MKHALLAFAAAVLCACAVPQGGGGPWAFKKAAAAPQPATTQYVDETLEVVTEPPGAQIMINDAVAGTSPLRYTVRRYWRGALPDALTLDTVKVQALPRFAGQCVQGGVYGESNKVISAPISFRMADCRNSYEYGTPSLDAPAEVKPESK